MAREIPEAVRAFAGLAVTVLDEARKLPETLPALPVRLIGAALQTSMKLQQQYSGLVQRGDELLTGLRGEAEPGMATFDEDVPVAGARDSAFDRVSEADLDTDLDTDLDGGAGAQLGELDELDVDPELGEALGTALAQADADPGAAELELVVTGEVPGGASGGASDGDGLTDAEVVDLPADPAADLVTAIVDDLADEVADEVAEELPEAVPDEVAEELTADAVADLADEEVAEETGIDDAVADGLVADAVGADAVDAETGTGSDTTDPIPAPAAVEVPDTAVEAAADTNAAQAAEAAETAAPLAELTPDTAPADTETLDDVQPPVEALAAAEDELTDLGGPEAAEQAADEAPAETAEGTTVAGEDASPAEDAQPAEDAAPTEDAGPTTTAPVEGYDAFTIPALRGHLRSYPAETVADLLDYERATSARAPYVTLLQNRLEKLNADRG